MGSQTNVKLATWLTIAIVAASCATSFGSRELKSTNRVVDPWTVGMRWAFRLIILG